MPSPDDLLAAATHRDPYAYYAELVRERPFYRDAGLGLWVASSAEAVRAVLVSDLCRVRPAHEPVPRALLGSAAGEVFRRLVRMTDGDGHARLKRAVSSALTGLEPDHLASVSAEWAAILWARNTTSAGGERVTAFALELSVHVVGSLLGIPREELARVAGWTGEFARCLAPASDPEQVALGIQAAAHLSALLSDLPRGPRDDRLPGLLAELGREGERSGDGDEVVVVANEVGLLSQAYEATAGLIGNTVLTLAGDPRLYETIVADPNRARPIVREVSRADPPIQSTRRFVVEDGMILGRAVRAGDVILVVLAAANADPAPARDLGRCDLDGDDRRSLSFGAGVHACPGDAIALTIAEAGIRQIVASGVPLGEVVSSVGYRPSVNARVPCFGRREASA